jgi:hypothetical protein
MAGIPTTIVTRQGFSQVVGNAYGGFGFPAEDPAVFEFPNAMFLEGSDLTPLQENIDKIVAGLTTWQPKITSKGVIVPPPVTVQGADYSTAAFNMNNLYDQKMWGDGLPLVPPTDAQIAWILTGTDLAPDTVIGHVLPKGGLATVHTIAVNLAMAGGRPEYMPVLIAAVQAMSDPAFKLESFNPTTDSDFPAIVVNGTISAQIRLNSGYGALGPDPVHPAGAAIGRATHLILQNVGGAIPGVGAMALFGGMRYTNAVFAEDENALPDGWSPLAVDRGFTKGANVVTVLPAAGASNVGIMSGSATEANAAAKQYLYRIAGYMAAPNMNGFKTSTDPNSTGGLVILPRTWAQQLASLGYTKAKVQQFLWDNSQMPYDMVIKGGFSTTGLKPGQARPVSATPAQITIVVAGGAQSAHAYWLDTALTQTVVSAEIKLPKNWDALIQQAAVDMGPLPAPMQ